MKKIVVIAIAMISLLTALCLAHAEAAPAPADAAAKSAALAHAALTEDAVTALTVQPDREDGREIIEVEFWKDATEYDYDVDAGTGEIIAFDIECKGTTLPRLSEAAISPEDALKRALDQAGLPEADATVKEAALKFKNGAAKYKFEFVAGGMEYEVKIDANDGAVLEYDVEAEDD